MGIITKVTDGDTYETTEDKLRVSNIDTPESVHSNEERNTPEGKVASDFMKQVLPLGSKVETVQQDQDAFGRKVSDVYRDINGVKVNMGLVALDQEFSQYYVEHGKHPDPTNHEQYKEYYSKDVPYQFGADNTADITKEDFADMQRKHSRFDSVKAKFDKNEATQEELDDALVALYQDPVKVVNFRKALNNWDRPIEQEDPTSLRGAMRIAMQDRELRETYNRAVQNGELIVKPYAREASTWDNMKNSMTLFSGVSDAMDGKELWVSRQNKAELEVEDSVLTQGVPPEYHAQIMAEALEYSPRSALVMRDQLIEDIENNKQFNDMSVVSQFGYGAAATIINPLTLVPAGGIAKLGKAAVDTTKYWQVSRLIAGKATVSGAATVAKLTAWTSMGGLEGALVNYPRLAADHTYTPKDYMLDTALDAGFGLAIGSIAGGVKAGYSAYSSKARESRSQLIEDIKTHVELQGTDDVADVNLIQPKEDVEIAKALETSNETISKWTNQPAVKVSNTQTSWVKETEFPKLAAIDKVSSEGLKVASRALKDVFPDKTPMRMLINSTVGLNNKKLPEDVAAEVVKLNADVLHIASAFHNGRVPKSVEQAISKVTFRQRELSTNNALADVLTGENIKSQVETLTGYVKSLRNKTELWGDRPITKFDSTTFIRMQSDWLQYQARVDDDALMSMRTEIPKQLSYLKDLVELNVMAQKQNNVELNSLVAELNGMAVVRMNQADKGELPRYSDSSKSWGATVAMSPPEIAKQLKKEGLQPRTTEYATRLKELRTHGRVAVKDEVNTLGKLKEQEVGEILEDSEVLEEAKRVTLVKEDFEQDLLPRSFIESKTVTAFKDPTLDSIKTLRKQLNTNIAKKLRVKELNGKADLQHVKERLDKVKLALLSDKQAVINSLTSEGKWQNVEDVIRASAKIAEEKKLRGTVPSTTPNEAVVKPLSEEDLQLVSDYLQGSKLSVTVEKVTELQNQVKDAYQVMVDESHAKIAEQLTKFSGSHEKLAWELAKKPTGVTDKVGRVAAKITEDITTKFHNSQLNSLEYFGSRVTELGRGYGGNIRRKETGGVIRDAYYKEAVMQISPQYVRIMDDYARSRGANAWRRLKAQWQAGADNQLVKEFNREVFTVQELRRQGKPTDHINKSVLEFVDNWDKFTDYTHNKFVENEIGGFTKERKIKHYIPHVWMSGQLQKAIREHGEDKVEALLEKAYKSAINNGTNPSKLSDAKDLAKRQIEWIKQQGEEATATDQYSPVSDSRAKERLDLDTTTELDGLTILDLMDSDVINVGTKYANRFAGWIGLSKSTDGMLTSQLDIDSLKGMITQEGKDTGINIETYEQYYEDVINMMFGRPTRGGLTTELREMKDLTALTRMGGLGLAQLIESGTVLTRSTMMLFSSDPVVRKIFATSKESPEDMGLLREIQSIASITDDLEYMDRQSVHLDQAELEKVNKLRQVSLWVADKATFGAAKAPASRLLGKVTGYNAIRRIQSRIVQASFTVDVARHFKDGKAKMSNARLADLGLTDPDGVDLELQQVFNTLVEYDSNGLVSKLNFEQWPKEARERFHFAMLRDDAQQIQRTLVGELPPWMNKPMMALAMQFRQMPIVANNKQLARSMAFADKEATTAVMLNTALAGLVRYSKFAALGTGVALLTGEEEQEPTADQMQMSKYITQLGVYADATDLVTSAFNAGQQDNVKDSFNAVSDVVLNQVPVLGLMSDYLEVGKGAAATAGADVDTSTKEQIDAAYGLMPLGNIAFADMIHAWMNNHFGEE